MLQWAQRCSAVQTTHSLNLICVPSTSMSQLVLPTRAYANHCVNEENNRRGIDQAMAWQITGDSNECSTCCASITVLVTQPTALRLACHTVKGSTSIEFSCTVKWISVAPRGEAYSQGMHLHGTGGAVPSRINKTSMPCHAPVHHTQSSCHQQGLPTTKPALAPSQQRPHLSLQQTVEIDSDAHEQP